MGGAGAAGPSTGRTRAHSSDSARVEQVAAEALTKAAHIVLGARLPGRAAGESGPSNRWFNLETEELACAARPLEPWRRDCGRPLVLDVLGGTPDATPELLERWTFWYRRKGAGGGGGSSSGGSSSGASSSSFGGAESWGSGTSASFSPGGTRTRRSSSESRRAGNLDTPLVYKRAVIMLRSLYSVSRRLPAHCLFATLRRRQQAAGAGGVGADMGFRIHSPDAVAGDLTAPQGGLAQFRFSGVETPTGFLDFSVQYLQELPAHLAAITNCAPQTAAVPAPVAATAPAINASPPLHRSPGSSCGASPPESSGLRPRRPSWSPVPAKGSSPGAGDLDVEYAPPRSVQMAAPTSASSSQSSGSYLGRSANRFSQSPVFGYLGSAGKPPLPGASPPLPGAAVVTAHRPAEAQRPRSGAITIGFAEGSSGGSYRASPVSKVPLPVSGLSPQARDLAAGSSLVTGSSGGSPGSTNSGETAPMSCSPQLPFAFTPRHQSLDSDDGGVAGASPPITGRNSMALSVVKRSTWSPRSSFDNGSRQTSPGLEATSLGTIPVAAEGIGLPDTAGWLHNSSKDSIEDFPFALECDFGGSGGHLTSYSAAGPTQGEGRNERSGSDPAGAAIGNLVRLLQEAPPLQKTNYRKHASVSSALMELKQMKESARQHDAAGAMPVAL